MIVEMDTVLDRANKILKANISKQYEEDFEIVRTFLFMNLCDRSKLKEKYVDFYNKYMKEYKNSKSFKKSIDICIKKLKQIYKNDVIKYKNGSMIDGKKYFDNIDKTLKNPERYNNQEESLAN